MTEMTMSDDYRLLVRKGGRPGRDFRGSQWLQHVGGVMGQIVYFEARAA